MGLSCFRAISGIGLGRGWVGLDLCAGLFYEHRFAMLIREGFKPPSHGKSPLGGEGGYPPFPLTFFCSIFGNQPSVKGGEGVPPFSVKFFR